MPFVTTEDGTEIFSKDWGSGQPTVFHHGDGRSTQTSDGHDMDTCAADAAPVADHLGPRDAVHFGHATGGGDVAGDVARHAAGPFCGFNREGATVSEGIIQSWRRRAMVGGVKAHDDGIEAFSETDFTEDLKAIDVPTLVLHGDDQVVPIADSAELSIELLEHGTSKVHPGSPHGMCTTHADVIDADLLALIQA